MSDLTFVGGDAKPRPISYADIADLAEAIGAPGAAHFRECAQDEAAGRLEDLAGARVALDGIEELLSQIPEPAKSTKHSDTCWQRHAHCLAARIYTGGAA